MNSASHFFAELYAAYAAEIEDNSTDSEGKVVLQQRLRTLRKQFDGYLPMMALSPEMVTVVFHDAFTFDSAEIVRRAVRCDPDDDTLPEWSTLASTVTIAPWAAPLVEKALGDESGERFLVIAACLEYLRSIDVAHASPVAVQDESDKRPSDDGDDEDAVDLGEAGDDWLSRQGFDSQR